MREILWITVWILFWAIIYYLGGAYLTWSFDYITHIWEWERDVREDYWFGLFVFCFLWMACILHKIIN